MLALACAPAASAATRFVDDSGSDAGPNDCLLDTAPCATISHAITQAAGGDTIAVGQGAYPEQVSVNKAVTITGPAAPATRPVVTGTGDLLSVVSGGTGATINRMQFDLTGNNSVEAVSTVVPATFSDLEINVGPTNVAVAFRSTLTGSTPAVLQNSVVNFNSSSSSGLRFGVGAESGPLTLNTVHINSTGTGFIPALAAFDGSGALSPAPSINATGITIHTTQGGACVFTRGGTSAIAGLVANQSAAAPTSNPCVTLGGANSTADNLTITSLNQAPSTPNGALMLESGTTVTDAVVTASTFAGRARCATNVTMRRGTYSGGGAGIYLQGSTGAVLGDLVARGTATGAQGVLLRDHDNCPGMVGAAGTLQNVTAVSGLNGDAVQVSGTDVGSNAMLHNTIARTVGEFGNDIFANAAVGSTASANYSNFDPARSIGVAPGGIGNQSADPLFVNFSGGDFHLQAGSPAINAGQNNGNLGPQDFEGDNRVLGAGPDIGADEAVPQAPAVVTGTASDVAATSVTLNGTVNPQGQSTNWRFQYGTSTAYDGQTAAATISSGTSPQAVSATVSNLQPETLYHFRVTATNGTGSAQGADGTFLTAVAPPADQAPAPAPSPAPSPSPSPTPAPSSALGPQVVISAAPVRVTKTGVANIRIGCPATAAQFCQGTLTLRTAARVNVAALRVLTLGKRTFRINAGARGVVGVKLSRQARRVLRRAKRLRIKAIANVRDANGASRITQRLLSLKAR